MKIRKIAMLTACVCSLSGSAADYAEQHLRRAAAEAPVPLEAANLLQAERMLEEINRNFVPTKLETPREELVFPVSRYGAAGDGVSDDGPAIRRAVAAAVKAGAGAVVRFEPKTYYLGPYPEKAHHILLNGVADLTIDGRGARLLSSPYNDFLALAYCARVNILNLTFESAEPDFTQGTVQKIQPGENAVVVQLDDGYPAPRNDAWHEANRMPRGYTMLIDSQRKFRKKNAALHHWLTSVVDLGERRVKLVISPRSTKYFSDFTPGDRLTLSVPHADAEYLRKGADPKVYAKCTVSVLRSSGCLFENLTFHGSRGMTFRIQENSGSMAFRRIVIEPRPGSADLISGLTDGMHCPNNRGGLLIEHCSLGNMLDDAINLMSLALRCFEVTPKSAVFSTTTPAVARLHQQIRQGDKLYFFDQKTGTRLGEVVLNKVVESEGKITVEWTPRLEALSKYGKERPLEDFCAYNTANSAAGTIVRNNLFQDNRRHALLVRAPGVTFHNNLVRNVGGCGVYAGNEVGHFTEGPFPAGLRISGNVFRSCAWSGIDTKVHAQAEKTERLIDGVRIEGNWFFCSSDYGLKLRDAEKVLLKDNSFVTIPTQAPLLVENSEFLPGGRGNRQAEENTAWRTLPVK